MEWNGGGASLRYVLGIDWGSTTTKFVLWKDQQAVECEQNSTKIQKDSLVGALSQFLSQRKIPLSSVSKIVLTGVRSSFISGNLCDIPTDRISEFEAIGCGGLYVSNLQEALVVSMGTGTAFVMADYNQRVHIGGSGLGGGTLCGLGKLLLNEPDISKISELANKGRAEKVDLLVKDICCDVIPTLPLSLTAANLGKLSYDFTSNDIALGLINMVLHNIGKFAIFAIQNTSLRDIVLTGTLTNIGQAKKVFSFMGEIFGVNFIIPDQAAFATAIGSIIYSRQNKEVQT